MYTKSLHQNIFVLFDEQVPSKSGKMCLVSIGPMTGEVVFDEFPTKMLDQRLSLIQPIEILIPATENDDEADLSKLQRQLVRRYVQERNSLSQVPVRIEERSSLQFKSENFQKALFDGEQKSNENGILFRQKWPSFGASLSR